MKKQIWTSPKIIELKSEEIRGWVRNEAFTIQKCANRLALETGVPCTYHVMRRAWDLLELGQVKKEARRRALEIEETDIVDEEEIEIPINELIQQRIKATQRKIKRFGRTHMKTIKLPAEPIGLIIFGDPHVDSEACDWFLLDKHVKLCQETEGVLAVSVGDQLDSWIGRLGKEYAKSSVTASDGWRLSEWLFKALQWLCIIGGNHDLWNDAPGFSPIQYLTSQCGVKFYAPDELLINIEWQKRPDLACHISQGLQTC